MTTGLDLVRGCSAHTKSCREQLVRSRITWDFFVLYFLTQFITGKGMPACTWNSQPHYCIRQLLESLWLHSHWEPQVQGSTSHWKVMSYPTYTAGSPARQLWTDVCLCQTQAQLLTVALHSKSLVAHTQPHGSYWNFSQYSQYLWIGFMHMLKHEFTFSEMHWKNSWFLSFRLYILASEKIVRRNRTFLETFF